MLRTDSNPALWRIALAILVAPGIAALVLGCIMPLPLSSDFFGEHILHSTWIYAAFGAYPTALLLGAPVVLLLRRRLRPTLGRCLLAGALVAITPWLLASMLSSSHTWGGAPLAALLGKAAAAGAVGGGAAWLLAAARPSVAAAQPEL